MLSNATGTALRDIQLRIRLAMEFVAGMDLDAFKGNLRTVYAVTRCLEIISEASRRLSDDVKTRNSGIAWREMAGAGNVYRHDYEEVAAQLVWDTVHRALPALKVVIEQEIARQSAADNQ